ncbi:hypothetical protein EsH8_VIII_000279 [Colletotrichum jinshuiense]
MSAITKFRNPIVAGFAPDPSVVLVNGTYFLVTSSFHIFPGLPIYASRDLQSWVHISNAIDRPGQLSLANASSRTFTLDAGHALIATGGLFAATIRHHHGTFYIVCTNLSSCNGSTEMQNFIIKTSDIWGASWSDPIPVEFNGIDPSLFFDDDDRAYFQGSFVIDRSTQPSCTIKQVEIDVGTGNQLSEQREIWCGYAKHDTEGPHVYKVDGWYYLLVAEGGTFEHHLLSIARSKNIWGPYESFEGNPIMTADGKNEYVQNVGHGELFQDQQGRWWAAVLGVRDDQGCAALGRESFLTPVEWPEGGWPQIAQPRMDFERESAESSAHLAADAETDENPLRSPPDVGNVYIRDPDLSKYRLPASEEGNITLLPSLSSLSTPTGTSTFLGRRQRSLTGNATTRLVLSGVLSSRTGIRAGLATYRDSIRHVSLVYNSDTHTVNCHAVNSLTGLDRISSTQLPLGSGTQAVWFKIQASPTAWSFHAKLDFAEGLGSEGVGEFSVSRLDWVRLETIMVRELDARDFTGPIFGLFAQTSTSGGEEVEVTFSDFSLGGE